MNQDKPEHQKSNSDRTRITEIANSGGPVAPTSDELDTVIDEFYYEGHDDDDHNTCATKYYTCLLCDEKWYVFNTPTAKCKHDLDSWQLGKCDCGKEKERDAFKEALISWSNKRLEAMQTDNVLERLKEWSAIDQQMFICGLIYKTFMLPTNADKIIFTNEGFSYKDQKLGTLTVTAALAGIRGD